MIEADAAIRANISNTLMAMSADPTQDPGVFLLLCKFRRAAFQQSTVGGCGSQAATPAARAAGAADVDRAPFILLLATPSDATRVPRARLL
jgi:hypothetical protein